MFTFLVILEIIISILLILIILIQNKGSGLSASFGGSGIGSMLGVRQASDFLTKGTAYLATAFIILAVVINMFFLPNKTKSGESVMQNGAPAQSQPATIPPAQVPQQQPTQNPQ